jgi:hypothetical protein
VTVNVVCVRTTVGVPNICPFVEFSDRPAGRLGLTENNLVPTPPVAVTGVKLAAMFLVSVLAAMTLVSTMAGGGGGASMVNVKFFELVCGTSSVTVTVCVIGPPDAEAVPNICPVSDIKNSPDGKLGEIEYTSVPRPPVAVTGVTDVDVPLTNVTDACARVVTISGGGGSAITVSKKLLELV